MPLESISQICTGCGACANACPHAAITVRENPDGFLRAAIDSDRCVSCGLCETICPLINPVSPDARQFAEPKVYAAYNLDERVRRQSSSGGIFDLLAREILRQGGVVFGAAFEKDFQVSQRGIRSPDALGALRFSKYVQSHTGATFEEVRQHLANERHVLYVGTPCMVAGLLAFLGKRSPYLFTCSFICHSAPSRKVWRKYLEYASQRAGGPLEAVCFRDKRRGWVRSCPVFTAANKREFVSARDWFVGGFVNGLFINDACLCCRFRGVNQLADVMLADFWGIETVRPELSADQKGISAVLVHTAQGEQLFRRCTDRMYFEEAPLDLLLSRNGRLVESGKAAPIPQRAQLLHDLDRLPIRGIMRKYPTQKTLLQRAWEKALRLMKKTCRVNG